MKSEVTIRGWRASDLTRLAELRLSRETLRSRFWGGVPAIPPSYLASIDARWPGDWDAVVAVRDGALIGWAEVGRNGASTEADVAMCVVDSERLRGIGTALLRALLARTGEFTAVHADIAGDNVAALRTWLRATRGLTAALTTGIGGLRGTVALPAGAGLAPGGGLVSAAA